MEETHCVYRHLNDEMYRYCLLVHQKKDGDRCYYHEAHTICCCFVPPDKETCDPMELDLVRPPVPTKLPDIHITARPVDIQRSLTQTTASTTTATTTTTTASAAATTVSTSRLTSTRTRTPHPTPIGNQPNKR
ncbi:hypothetical protein NECAME_12573 [Necator americanus]|uniref:Uncharacterized protein n=1 Tax=Necator americanus TaxID=51031 RepID=W2T0B6_NECAM|nr:hypothetical protein NECAME_12573 [Necator americanus]ETN75004.1 hypothetical protein NECAME_12573 [Necator americanus]